MPIKVILVTIGNNIIIIVIVLSSRVFFLTELRESFKFRFFFRNRMYERIANHCLRRHPPSPANFPRYLTEWNAQLICSQPTSMETCSLCMFLFRMMIFHTNYCIIDSNLPPRNRQTQTFPHENARAKLMSTRFRLRDLFRLLAMLQEWIYSPPLTWGSTCFNESNSEYLAYIS